MKKVMCLFLLIVVGSIFADITQEFQYNLNINGIARNIWIEDDGSFIFIQSNGRIDKIINGNIVQTNEIEIPDNFELVNFSKYTNDSYNYITGLYSNSDQIMLLLYDYHNHNTIASFHYDLPEHGFISAKDLYIEEINNQIHLLVSIEEEFINEGTTYTVLDILLDSDSELVLSNQIQDIDQCYFKTSDGYIICSQKEVDMWTAHGSWGIGVNYNLLALNINLDSTYDYIELFNVDGSFWESYGDYEEESYTNYLTSNNCYKLSNGFANSLSIKNDNDTRYLLQYYDDNEMCFSIETPSSTLNVIDLEIENQTMIGAFQSDNKLRFYEIVNGTYINEVNTINDPIFIVKIDELYYLIYLNNYVYEFYTLNYNYVNNENVSSLNNSILLQNYPNPFNPSTIISFNSNEYISTASLYIYNLRGRLIYTKKLTENEINSAKINWNASNSASGIYFAKIITNSGSSNVKKIMLIK